MNYKNPGNYSGYCTDYADITLTAACAYPTRMTNVIDADGNALSWDRNATDPNTGRSLNRGRPLYDENGNCWDDDYDSSAPPGIPADPFPDDCAGHSITFVNDIELYDRDGVKMYDDVGAASRYTAEKQLWDSFVSTFNLYSDQGDEIAYYDLKDTNGVYNESGYRTLTSYFVPSCRSVQLGGTGGDNFGVRAEEPVLVF
jgi:hypothetical protein